MNKWDMQEYRQQDIQRLERMMHRLGERIEEALEELRYHPVKIKIRKKQLGYDQDTSKIQWEKMEEWEELETREGEIDVDNLRKIVSALKDWSGLYPDSSMQREEELQRVLARLEGRPWPEVEE